MNRYFIKEDGQLFHIPKIKLVINPFLRLFQFYTKKPFVIASITDVTNEKPIFIEFKFVRVTRLGRGFGFIHNIKTFIKYFNNKS